MMKIPTKGHSGADVLDSLRSYRGHDVPWRDGKSLFLVFHAGEEVAAVAERAYLMYLWENALDPTQFPSLMRIETEIVSMAASHLRGDDNVVGNFTSGGTESVLLAVKTARDFARAKNPNLGRPQMVLPETAHPCFYKAAHYFDVEPVVTPVDPTTFRADVDAMRAAVTDRTVLLVGSATSYAHGVVDPIPEIGQLALEKDLLLHVDGCIGGFLLPLFRELGADVSDFDFTVPGVTSISMDFHKYAFCPKGASVVLYKNAELRQHQIFTHSAWPGYTVVNPTIQSSKSGGPLAAAWAVLQHLGKDGYLKLASGMLEGTKKVRARVDAMEDLSILGNPEMTLFAFGGDNVNVFRVCDQLEQRGWAVHPQFAMGKLQASFHANIMPLNLDHLDNWLDDLETSVKAAKQAAPSAELAALRAALSSIDLTKLDDRGVDGLLELAGLGSGELPGEELNEILEIMNDIPSDIKDRFYTVYYNRLSRYRPQSA